MIEVSLKEEILKEDTKLDQLGSLSFQSNPTLFINRFKNT